MGEKRKKSLWARIMTCIQINRALGGFSYVPLSSKEQRYHLVRLIEYRAELALYEAYKAAGRIMPWDHFVLLVQHNCGLKKAVIVICSISIFQKMSRYGKDATAMNGLFLRK